jgi:hypothetical protein
MHWPALPTELPQTLHADLVFAIEAAQEAGRRALALRGTVRWSGDMLADIGDQAAALAAEPDNLVLRAARALRLPRYGIAVGNDADLVVWGEDTPGDVVAKAALPLAGFKRGRRLFSRRSPVLERP